MLKPFHGADETICSIHPAREILCRMLRSSFCDVKADMGGKSGNDDSEVT